jgi:hypothetical protein
MNKKELVMRLMEFMEMSPAPAHRYSLRIQNIVFERNKQ